MNFKKVHVVINPASGQNRLSMNMIYNKVYTSHIPDDKMLAFTPTQSKHYIKSKALRVISALDSE